MIEIILIGLLLSGCIAMVIVQEFLDKTSYISMWLWCRKNKLTLKEGICYCYKIEVESEFPNYVAIWGVDSNGNMFYRGKDDIPTPIKPETPQKYIYL